MSFHVSKEEPLFDDMKPDNNHSSKLKIHQVTPSDQLLSELPISKYLKINPSYRMGYKDIFLQAMIDFDLHSSDVFVCSLPKCGSSWMQTIVWLLTHGLNYEAAKTLNRLEQMGDFDDIGKIKAAEAKAQELLKKDVQYLLNVEDAHKMAWNEVFKTMDSPRIFKTHNPIFFLPKIIWAEGAKIVYIVRNPKDMIASMYHYMRNTFHINSSMDEYVNRITSDRWYLSPVLDHILNFWRVKHLKNVLIVAYEDLVNDAFASIKTISEFLECKYSDEQLKELTEYISFDNMKKNNAINREQDIIRMENVYGRKRPDAEFTFLRRGKVGGYRDDLNADQIQKIDEWIKNGLKDTDFRFKI